ncbi:MULTISPECIES: hypothetical protein [unclassified Roseateles]|uniref:hypothetical protein n=1 Tax=unclassified Roseateles TaxID=2626991 RepID=UPI0006FF2C39|nr:MULTISPECIES: hypothetical protein [unclassified Roseateles]KQW51477.1 hypothetical protein ASC81_02215 [Pelomonas sp. Root405]KRA77710.1 hypothetical protein ASD88_02215 [Pelomonas sp. Root662]
MGKKEIRDLENIIGSAALMLPRADGEDKLHFHDEGYPYLQELDRRAKGDLVKLGMAETVERAIQECVVLVTSPSPECPDEQA